MWQKGKTDDYGFVKENYVKKMFTSVFFQKQKGTIICSLFWSAKLPESQAAKLIIKKQLYSPQDVLISKSIQTSAKAGIRLFNILPCCH